MSAVITQSGKTSFANYIAANHSDPTAMMIDCFDDLALFAHGYGALVEEPPLLETKGYLPNLEGKRDSKQGYWCEIVRDNDGVFPTVTINSFKGAGLAGKWNPRDTLWKRYEAEKDGGSIEAFDAQQLAERRAAAEIAIKAAEARKAERERLEAIGRDTAAAVARDIWETATACTDHAYLAAKDVKPFGLRVARGTIMASLWDDHEGAFVSVQAVKAGDLLIPLSNADGVVVNLQRIDAKGEKRFLKGALKKGTAYFIAGTEPALIAEGYATAATVHAATGRAVYVGLDAGNLAAVVDARPGKISAVAADNDEKGAGEKGAQATGLPLAMPPTVGQDWNDYAASNGLEAVAAELVSGKLKQPETIQKQQAVDIFGNLELPPFSVGVLPKVIADYAADQSELIGVDPAVIGITALVAMAACIDDRIEIQPKRHDPTWTESPRLWAALIGGPSVKKTPGISKAMSPLHAIARRWQDDNARKLAAWDEECEGLEKGAKTPPKPILKRLMLNDATVEKMGAILSECEPRGILSHQDELSGWLSSMDAYKNGGGKDRAAWLEAYNGGGKSIDRISRGSIFVENWSACVVGGIQPSVVQSYANVTNHDGMLQRFMLIHARDADLGVDRSPNMAAIAAYKHLADQLSELQPPSAGSVVKLSEAAHKIREAFNARLHKAVLCMPNKFLTAALGKWEGLFARVLLTYHCIECASAGVYPTSTQVAAETAEKVDLLLWRTLFPHMVSFYQGLDLADDHARQIAALILARSWPRFTVKRDLDRYMRATRSMKPWELEQALDRLEAFGWIYPEPGKVNEKGKPSAYQVNDDIHSRFAGQAEAERERRAAVVEIMKDLKS